MKRKREEIPVPRRITRQTNEMSSVSVNYKEEISDGDESSSDFELFRPNYISDEEEIPVPRRITRQTNEMSSVSVNYKEEISDGDESSSDLEPYRPNYMKEISDEEELSIDPGEQLSEYEKKRMENMKMNEEMMIALNLKQVTNELNVLKESNKKRSTHIGFTSKPKPKQILRPSRRSLRIQTKNSDHPMKFIDEPVIPAAEEIERKPSGALNIMVPLNDITNEESQTFLTKVASERSQMKEDAEIISATRYKDRISNLHILPNHVAKIAPNAIHSMTLHPSLTKLILCVGDKRGNIGFWDVDAMGESSNNGIFVYEPHYNAVTTVSFHPDKSNNLYSCSYDGTVRCADFNTCVFDEVYCTDNNTINCLSYPHSSLDTIILGQSNGKVALVDTREKKSAHNLHQCHTKAIKCVHCSPTNANLFCTSSTDAFVALWDIRKIKNIKSKLESVHLGRPVTSAYFSPISGQQILTTSLNDYIKVFELTSSLKFKTKKTFKHVNQTSRQGLTPFRATWDPKHDCGIVIGSMLHRRRIQIYHSEQSDGSPFIQLFDEKYDTITSINVFHNTRNILASGNASGKVYIWTEKTRQ